MPDRDPSTCGFEPAPLVACSPVTAAEWAPTGLPVRVDETDIVGSLNFLHALNATMSPANDSAFFFRDDS